MGHGKLIEPLAPIFKIPNDASSAKVTFWGLLSLFVTATTKIDNPEEADTLAVPPVDKSVACGMYIINSFYLFVPNKTNWFIIV